MGERPPVGESPAQQVLLANGGRDGGGQPSGAHEVPDCKLLHSWVYPMILKSQSAGFITFVPRALFTSFIKSMPVYLNQKLTHF